MLSPDEKRHVLAILPAGARLLLLQKLGRPEELLRLVAEELG
jgi:hypothetical protein